MRGNLYHSSWHFTLNKTFRSKTATNALVSITIRILLLLISLLTKPLYLSCVNDTCGKPTLTACSTLYHSGVQQHFEIDVPDPVEAIKFRMKEQGLIDADLVPLLGQRIRAHAAVNKKRKLSSSMITVRLHRSIIIEKD